MKYNFNDAKYGTHGLIAEEISRETSVLDAGCNKGYLKNVHYWVDYWDLI